MNKDRDMNIVVLPGDGAGPEVSAEAVKCLELLSDHCGLDLRFETLDFGGAAIDTAGSPLPDSTLAACKGADAVLMRSEEHTSELQSLMRISYAVFCLKKNKNSKH